jgi:uncharacterized 2Fe-2S/4Fe-4S cluster protein (DUF4445 family)
MGSLITLERLDIQPSSEDDRRADAQRIQNSLGLDSIDIPLSLLRKIPFHRGNELSCIVARHRNGCTLIDIETDSSYAIALDIGTTNLVAALYDNVSQSVISEAKIENPQIAYGSDILTRLHHSMSGKDKEINQCLLDGVNTIIKKLCDEAGIKQQNIHALVAAGNTVMSHYFLGLDVGRIPVAPYTPVVRKPGFFKAADLSLNINEEALVYVFPNAGSYVGGDIVAGMFASGIFTSEEPCVLIDVGTNAEIVVGNKDWLLVGAGAAGPALEEGIAGIGKRAESGIIYDIEISDNSIDCRTFNDAPAGGICGSGMVSLIHEMYRAGIIGNDGILNNDHNDVQALNGETLYTLKCASGNGLEIKQTEIDNFLRSKAAMFTLLLVILRSVGLEFKDIDKVYVAGALGKGIDAEKAANIGMLPNWPADKIIPIGNASLQGALMALKDSSLLDKEDELTDNITYKHMHDDPEFMQEFRGAIFIPHTNPDMLQV